MKRRRVVVLGATGSIGASAARVARAIPDRMQIVGLSGHRNVETLAALAREFPDARLCLTAPDADPAGLPVKAAEVLRGEQGLIELAAMPDADLVLVAIVGTGGLRPALAAIDAGHDLAIASKEILVMAGETVLAAARRTGVHLLPVDSEHNAIFQCLDRQGNGTADAIRRLILTASGGPFRTWPAARLAEVTPAQALNHPTWDMGPKITVDSATLFNKGLEMIEAHWLFNVPMTRIEVVIHPQSIIHSMVEFIDGSVLAQMSVADMCFPIQYAVTWPERVASSLPPLDLTAVSRLEFHAPRTDDFPALALARLAGETGGTLPAVLNAANEVAVAAFLAGRIPFPRIWQVVETVMNRHTPVAHPSLETILAADHWARTEAERLAPAGM